MSFKSIKILTLSLSLLAAVACGKNNNNLSVDGHYIYEGATVNDMSKGVELVEPKGFTLVKIEKNVLTSYTFTEDKKSAEVRVEKLIIKGKKLIGTELIEEDKCNGSTLEVGKDQEANVVKSKAGLVFSASIQGKDNSKIEIAQNYKSIAEEEFAALTQDLRDKKVERVCINEEGKVVKKFDGDKVIDIEKVEEKAAATVEENKIDNSSALTTLETSAEDSI